MHVKQVTWYPWNFLVRVHHAQYDASGRNTQNDETNLKRYNNKFQIIKTLTCARDFTSTARADTLDAHLWTLYLYFDVQLHFFFFTRAGRGKIEAQSFSACLCRLTIDYGSLRGEAPREYGGAKSKWRRLQLHLFIVSSQKRPTDGKRPRRWRQRYCGGVIYHFFF